MRLTREEKIDIGAEITVNHLIHNLPLDDFRYVANVLQRVYMRHYQEELLASGYKWKPKYETWEGLWSEIRQLLREKYSIFIEYVRPDRGFHGQWERTDKKTWVTCQVRNSKDIKTRIGHYEDNLDAAAKRWKFTLPRFDRPMLPPPSGDNV